MADATPQQPSFVQIVKRLGVAFATCVCLRFQHGLMCLLNGTDDFVKLLLFFACHSGAPGETSYTTPHDMVKPLESEHRASLKAPPKTKKKKDGRRDSTGQFKDETGRDMSLLISYPGDKRPYDTVDDRRGADGTMFLKWNDISKCGTLESNEALECAAEHLEYYPNLLALPDGQTYRHLEMFGRCESLAREQFDLTFPAEGDTGATPTGGDGEEEKKDGGDALKNSELDAAALADAKEAAEKAATMKRNMMSGLVDARFHDFFAAYQLQDLFQELIQQMCGSDEAIWSAGREQFPNLCEFGCNVVEQDHIYFFGDQKKAEVNDQRERGYQRIQHTARLNQKCLKKMYPGFFTLISKISMFSLDVLDTTGERHLLSVELSNKGWLGNNKKVFSVCGNKVGNQLLWSDLTAQHRPLPATEATTSSSDHPSFDKTGKFQLFDCDLIRQDDLQCHINIQASIFGFSIQLPKIVIGVHCEKPVPVVPSSATASSDEDDNRSITMPSPDTDTGRPLNAMIEARMLEVDPPWTTRSVLFILGISSMFSDLIRSFRFQIGTYQSQARVVDEAKRREECVDVDGNDPIGQSKATQRPATNLRVLTSFCVPRSLIIASILKFRLSPYIVRILNVFELLRDCLGALGKDLARHAGIPEDDGEETKADE